VQCPQCQHDHRPGQKFGGECGARLASRCRSCGAANPREHNCCGECRRPLTPAPPSDKFAGVAAVCSSAGWRRGRDIAVWRIGGGHMRRVLGAFVLTTGVLTASSGEIELATQVCWKKLNGKAQVEWYGHLKRIDEYDRAERVRTSTTMAVTDCVATDTSSRRNDPSVWRIVEVFVKQQFR
jgi:hypothetical protein